MIRVLTSPEKAQTLSTFTGKSREEVGEGPEELKVEQFANAFPEPASMGERLHLLLINPWIGYPLALFILFFCFYIVMGIMGAGTAVRFLEETVFGEIILPACDFLALKYIKGNVLKELLMGQFGLISMGLRYSFAIVLPLVTMYFLFFALLEDCGYLPRLSYLLHRPLGYLGLDGRGAIPLVLGFGCGTMGVLVTRLLKTRRERFLATFLLSWGSPARPR